MTIDVKQIGVFADSPDNMLVPNLGQHGAAWLSQGSSPYGSRGRRCRPLPAALHASKVSKPVHQSMTDGHSARAGASPIQHGSKYGTDYVALDRPLLRADFQIIFLGDGHPFLDVGLHEGQQFPR